jgi:hypothetical protein
VDGVRFPTLNIINIITQIVTKGRREEFIPPFGYNEVVEQIREYNQVPPRLKKYFEPVEEEVGSDSSYTTPTSAPAANSTPHPRSARVTVRRGSRDGVVRKIISET